MDMIMLTEPKILLLVAGLFAGGYMLSIMLWSYMYPQRRLWPPKEATSAIKFRVWFLTTLIYAVAFFLGLLDWNYFDWSTSTRWVVGLPLILIGNIAVWSGVFKIGMAATSGEATGLKTDGMYSYSRNPQYVADIAILIGWGVLSASVWALPILMLGFAVLVVAPFAEEPWLEEVYGAQYREYKKLVRRFL